MNGAPRFVAAMIAALSSLALVATSCSGSADDEVRPGPTTTTTPAPTEVPNLVAPDAKTFDVDDGTATLACQGNGPVPVILIAGTDDPITRWDVVVDDLGQAVLACRFGPPVGPDATPSYPARQADALSQALDASGLPGPYVLVGHSLGGLTVRRFGQRHPDQLAAALLLDATTPVALLSIHAELEAFGWDPDATQADAEAPAPWPDVPLTVFAHDPAEEPLGLGPDVEALWTEGQLAYATLTDDADLEQLEGTGHYVDHDATRPVTNEIIRLVGLVS